MNDIERCVCGGEAMVSDFGRVRSQVVCRDCPWQGGAGNTEQEAIDAWNAVMHPARIASMILAGKEILREENKRRKR